MDKLLKSLQGNLIAIVVVLMVLGWCQTGWSEPSPSSASDLENIKVLDLQTAARIALEDNPSLAAAQARVSLKPKKT